MNLNKTGDLEIKCEKCETAITISCSDLDFQIVEKNDRSMGIENHYNAKYDFSCEKCNNEIKVSYDVWEYPIGMINTTDLEISGCKIINECNFSMEE